MFSSEDRRKIAWEAPHSFDTWDDFPTSLSRLKQKYLCCSFTILSFRIIIDTARKNQISWDAVFSCEAIGKYKTLSAPYETVAKWLNLSPDEICMVACHNFDLDAAKKVSGMDLPVIHSDRRPGDPAVVLASAEKAERLLEWSPAFSDVETILKTMLAAYRSHHR